MNVTVERVGQGPIITPHMDGRMGDNINGPSLVRVPDWVPNPLGRYYLYFGHHDGRYIRLAFADELKGPWRMHEPGVLSLADSLFHGHIASPDVYLDHEARQIRLYYHGADFPGTAVGVAQYSRVAVSSDGLAFEARAEVLSRSYLRVIAHDGGYLGMAMPGLLYRSRDGLTDFESGPGLFDADMRHLALVKRDGRLLVFYSQVGDVPERILLSEVALNGDWMQWRSTPPVVVLEPERDYEGGDEELAPSIRGLVMGPVRQLRDPAVYVEGDDIYLVYSVAGEYGLALARVRID